MNSLNTDRLDIVPLSLDFSEEILKANTGNVREYFIPFNSLGEVSAWISEYFELFKAGKKIEYLLLEKASHSLVGMVALDNLNTEKVEIRLWINPDKQKLGFAKEACTQICSEFKKGNENKQIIYSADIDNIPSNKLALSLGFVYNRKYEYEPGQFYNEYVL